jgi:sodium/proline symporter
VILVVEWTDTVLLTFLLYFLVLLGLGVLAYRRTRNLSDYILGGRTLGSWVSAFSAQASDMSGWLLMGLPGLAYTQGLEAFWMALGLALGTYLNWLYVAEPLRATTLEHDDSLTLPVYFERRFEDDTGTLRLVSALVILVFFTFYTSSGLVAGAKLFETVFGVTYVVGVTAGGAAILLYTLIGGFLAVSWTDFLQGILMFLSLGAVLVVGLESAGGVEHLRGGIADRNPNLLSMISDAEGNTLSIVAVLSLAGWGLGYFGQPHILARFMAIRDSDAVPRARRIAVSWVVFCLATSVAAGMMAIPMLDRTLSGPETEKAFIFLAEWLFHPALAGVVLAAVLAAIMSTADSQLLVASSAVAEDLYAGFWDEEASRRQLLWIGRMAVLVISLVAFFIALDPENMVLGLVAYAWAGFGAAFGPVVLLSLYWGRMNKYGAFSGMVVGGGTVVLWGDLSGGIFELYELVPGFVLASLAAVVGSLMLKGSTIGPVGNSSKW